MFLNRDSQSVRDIAAILRLYSCQETAIFGHDPIEATTGYLKLQGIPASDTQTEPHAVLEKLSEITISPDSESDRKIGDTSA
jgi:hypothetical protein